MEHLTAEQCLAVYERELAKLKAGLKPTETLTDKYGIKQKAHNAIPKHKDGNSPLF